MVSAHDGWIIRPATTRFVVSHRPQTTNESVLAAPSTTTPPPTRRQPYTPASADAINLDPLIKSLTARTTSSTHPARAARTAVEEAFHRYDEAPIRTFLPVLIMRRAEDQLRARGLLTSA
jgi:hypothetical protein